MIKSTVVATCVADLVFPTLKNSKTSAIKKTNIALASGSPNFRKMVPIAGSELRNTSSTVLGRRVAQYCSGEFFKVINRFSSCGSSISSFSIVVSF